MLPYIQNSRSVTLFHKGRPYTLYDTHPHYQEIIAKLDAGDDDGFEPLIESPVVQAVKGSPDFSIRDGVLYYLDQPQENNYLAKRIVQMAEQNKPIEALLKHYQKTQANPSNRVVEELFKFMEQNEMPITPQGNFLAYKRVNANYTDVHSGTISNHIGATPSLPRNRVDDNPNNTCSHGLHVCSFAYLRNFSGERVVICEVNPQDVVAIPTDYNHTKMRVAQYKVVGEIPLSTAHHIWQNTPYVDEYESEFPDEKEEEYNDEDDFIDQD